MQICLCAKLIPWWDGTREISVEQRRLAGGSRRRAADACAIATARRRAAVRRVGSRLSRITARHLPVQCISLPLLLSRGSMRRCHRPRHHHSLPSAHQSPSPLPASSPAPVAAARAGCAWAPPTPAVWVAASARSRRLGGRSYEAQRVLRQCKVFLALLPDEAALELIAPKPDADDPAA